MEIGGPNEVLFDRPQVFKLTISNPGTGTAESVKIDLLPPGGEQSGVSSHPLGDLTPGESKTVEVELTPREAGKMMVKAIASADGGLSSEAAKDVFCQAGTRSGLAWSGDEVRRDHAGNLLHSRAQPGYGPGRGRDDSRCPAEAPSSRARAKANRTMPSEVSWQVGSLGPGDDNYMEIKCVLKSPGANPLKMATDSRRQSYG